MPSRVGKYVERSVFGRDAAAYDRARLAYPERIYQILTTRCGLRPGTAVVEIGPGTGKATRELFRRGARPLTLVELDPRLARYLARRFGRRRPPPTILVGPFEKVRLPPASFDLCVAANSFHWLPQRLAFRRVARALKPGGWWAAWTHHYGDPYRASRFHEALQPLYLQLSHGRSPASSRKATVVRERRKRLAALESTGQFDRIACEGVHWSVTMGAARAEELWGTFSDIIVRPDRERRWFLSELRRIADQQFGGRVTFPMLTRIYTARRI